MDKTTRESINFSIANYLGVVISLVSTIFLYPLDFEIYGNIQFLMSTSLLFLPVVSFAVSRSFIHFFHQYRDVGKLDELFTLFVLIVLVILGGFMISYNLFLEDKMYHLFKTLKFDTVKLKTYQTHILILTYVLTFFTLSTTILSNFKEVALPQVFDSFVLKIIISVTFLIAYFEVLSLKSALNILIVYYLLASLFLWKYQGKFHRFRITKISSYTLGNIKEIIEYSFYNIVSVLGSSLVFRLDVIMITLMIGAKEAGIYTLFLFMANVIEVPSKGYIKIVSPIISEKIKKNRLTDVEDVYQKSSVNFLIIGGLVAVLIYAGLEPLLALMKNGEELLKVFNVWVILVIAKWIDMITSVNSQIITFSKIYRYNLWILLVLGLTNVGLNYVFINAYGLLGAALATAISITLYNIIKFVVIKIKFDLQPFTTATVKGIMLLLLWCVALYFIPYFGIPVLDILLRCSVTGLVLGVLIYRLNLSKEINSFINQKVLFLNDK